MTGTANTAAIEVENLVTHFGARKILDGVNAHVEEGEILIIMGGSGSGKSTLLRHVLGLHRPTSGSIRLLGRDITRAASWRSMPPACWMTGSHTITATM